MPSSLDNETSLHWFVARTRSSQEISLRDRLGALGVECFIPTRAVVKMRRGRRVKAEVPLIPNMVFVHASKQDACALANGRGLALYYIVDRFTRSMLVIPDKQMADFIQVVNYEPQSVCLDDVPIMPGTKVRVVSGELAGIEGEVLSLPTATYVVVNIGRILCAKVHLPKSSIEPVE